MISLVVHSQLVQISSLMFVFADMMQRILDLHHDIFFFLILISWILVHCVWKTYNISVHLALQFSIPAIHIVILIFYFSSCILTNVALCMDSGGPLEIPTSSVVTQDDLFNELERKEQLEEVKKIIRAHEAIGKHIVEFRSQEGMRRPGGFQTERLVEMLEQKYGGKHMLLIEQDMQEKGHHSEFYKETKTFFNYFRREGATEARLRKTWQGR